MVRRASELDAVVPQHESDLDVDEARSVLREAGVSSVAAEQALQEWRRGQLPVQPPPPLPDAARRSSAIVTVERTVAMDPTQLRRSLDAHLYRQCFARGRQYGVAGCEWVPRKGLFADLRRKLDFRGTILLDEVSRVRLEVTPGKPGTVVARLAADLEPYRSKLVGGMVVVPAAAGAIVSLIGIPVESLELFATGLPVGLAVAGGGYLGLSRAVERRKARIDEALNILFDRLGAR